MAVTGYMCGCSYARTMGFDPENIMWLWINFCWNHMFIDRMKLTLKERVETLKFWIQNEWMLEMRDDSYTNIGN